MSARFVMDEILTMAIDAQTLVHCGVYIRSLEKCALDAGDNADAVTLRLIEVSLTYLSALLAAHGSVIEVTTVDRIIEN